MAATVTFPTWRSYDRASLDAQYSPSLWTKDFAGNLNRYAGETAVAKRCFATRGKYDIPYGQGTRQRLDVFPAMTGDKLSPIHVFIHGGFWQEFEQGICRISRARLRGRGQRFCRGELYLGASREADGYRG